MKKSFKDEISVFYVTRIYIPLRNNSGWLLLDSQNSILYGIKNQDSHQNNYCPLAFKWNWIKCTLNHTSYVRSHITRNRFLLHGGLNWQPGQNKPAAYNLVTFSGILPPNQNIGLVISVLDIFLDIGQWASKWNKSMAKKDKPLVEKKYRGGGGWAPPPTPC